MRWIKGKIELRKANAIGDFTVYPCRTQANSLDLAREYLIDDAHAYGFEPRTIFDLQPTTKEDYDRIPENIWE
jgi:hypothetical protein